MRILQYIKRLVVLIFVIEVTSRPTPYGSRLINFLGSSIGARAAVGCGNYCDDGRRHHNQKNIGTGSDSSLVEISFQPLRELESVSSLTSLYPLVGKQYFYEDPPVPVATVASSSLASEEAEAEAEAEAAAAEKASPHHPRYLSTNAHSQRQRYRYFYRQRRSRHQLPLNDNDLQSYRQRYPVDSSANEGLITPFAPFVSTLNGNPYPAAAEEEETEDPFGFMHRDDHHQSSVVDETDLSFEERDKLRSMDGLTREDFRGKPHPVMKGLMEGYNYMDSDSNNKRNALAAFKRQKFKSHHTQFIPSISGGAMTNLGDFFKNLKNNIEFMEKNRLSNSEEILLEGDHPIHMLREELNSDMSKPTGTAAFLHAIRTYRPSAKIRSLVSLNPEGYHGSQFLDPNYMWVGLGKR